MYSRTTHIININQAGVGYYLHREGPNLGQNIVSLFSCYHPALTHSSGPPTRDPPVLTPTLVLSLRVPLCRRRSGPMAALIINNDEVQGETFLPGQIFVFGGFALRANSLSHLEQIESYAPSHQVRFGSLNYTADIRGDLIFDEFEPPPTVSHHLEGHDIALPPDSAL